VLSPDLLANSNALNLSVVSSDGVDHEMNDQGTDGQSTSTSPPETLSKGTPGAKGAKRKVNGQQKSNKKAATSFFG